MRVKGSWGIGLVVAAIVLAGLGCNPWGHFASGPKRKAKSLVSTMHRVRAEVAEVLHPAGLPMPPLASDMLTGGNFGAAMDLKQALEQGFAPSCQIIYENSLSSIKGLVVVYSRALGDSVPDAVMGVSALMPPTLERDFEAFKATADPAKRKALQEARRFLVEGFQAIKELGPFTTAKDRVAGGIPGLPGVDSSGDLISARKADVAGLGRVWNYRLLLPPCGQTFGGAPDGSAWVVLHPNPDYPDSALRVKDGKILSKFSLEPKTVPLTILGNDKGLVALASVFDPETHKSSGLLVQYDFDGKVLWKHLIEGNMQGIRFSLATTANGDVFTCYDGMGGSGGIGVRKPDPVTLVRVSAAGVKATLTAPEGARKVSFVYTAPDGVYALLEDRGGFGLHQVVGDGFVFFSKADYAFFDGSFIRVGGDGGIYLNRGFGDKHPDPKVVSLVKAGASPREFSTPASLFEPMTGNFQVGKDGRIYVLTSKGIVVAKAEEQGQGILMPYGGDLPQMSKLVPVGSGRFLGYFYQNSGISGMFSVVEMR